MRREGPNERTGIAIVERGDPGEASLFTAAMEVWRALNEHYPNHPWHVQFQGGALIVKHSLIDAYVTAYLKRQGFGFLMPKDKVLTNRTRDTVQGAIIAGGEMLELFSMRRAAWDGEEVPSIPKDWKPRMQKNFS